jgi:5-methylcytosine-specific restriction endonuclease McrA
MNNNLDVFTTIAFLKGLRCHLCKQGPIDDDPWEVDHLRPRARGGDLTDWNNLDLAHRSCNRRRGISACITAEMLGTPTQQEQKTADGLVSSGRQSDLP